jgi:hypothetical protein
MSSTFFALIPVYRFDSLTGTFALIDKCSQKRVLTRAKDCVIISILNIQKIYAKSLIGKLKDARYF